MSHRSPLTCVDANSSTDLIVTGGYDGRVVAWRDEVEIWSTQFDDLINDVRIHPDGDSVAVAAADSYAFVLDAADGAIVASLGPHGDDVNVVRWLPDGGLVCTMDHVDPTVRVWTPDGDTKADDPWTVRTLAQHDSGVFGAAVSPDGSRVATAAEDGTARIWELADGRLIHTLDHPGDPETVDWSPDGTIIATGCDDGILRLWSPDDGTVMRELTDSTAAVRLVRFSEDGTRLLAGAYDATLRSYDTQSWAVTEELRLPMQWERSACVAGERVVVGSFGAEPVFHPPSAPARPLPLTRGINALSAAGGRLLVGRDDGSVSDLLDGTLITRHESIVNGVAMSADGGLIASGDYRGSMHLADTSSGDVIQCRVGRGGPINTVVFDETDHVVFSAGYDGFIRQWSFEGELVAEWRAHHSPVKSLAWTAAEGGLLVAGSSDGTLTAWRSGTLVWRAEADDLVLVNSVAIADDAGLVVSASRDLHVRQWDVLTGQLVERLARAHHKSIKAVASSPDGHSIVSGAYDGSAILWTRTSADARWSWRRLNLHGKPGVPAVAITERNVFTAGWNGTVGRWSADGRVLAEY